MIELTLLDLLALLVKYVIVIVTMSIADAVICYLIPFRREFFPEVAISRLPIAVGIAVFSAYPFDNYSLLHLLSVSLGFVTQAFFSDVILAEIDSIGGDRNG